MDDAELLRRELRAAREERVRKQSKRTDESTELETHLPLMPDRDDEFLRLALMSVDELETHIERLERDLKDLEESMRNPDE